ncbi:hypothetical protein BDN72DRAFT_902106 [Pluteus cervinus]|uniref:Uncharacterized protein n=1 Tax=Pluteus cervinus TaxID=181527 RepID=A0ACD3ADH5_9AGAR|nr:hypothetical protein BDN72DRAFT_902106 [Pluteus cervinus]
MDGAALLIGAENWFVFTFCANVDDVKIYALHLLMFRRDGHVPTGLAHIHREFLLASRHLLSDPQLTPQDRSFIGGSPPIGEVFPPAIKYYSIARHLPTLTSLARWFEIRCFGNPEPVKVAAYIEAPGLGSTKDVSMIRKGQTFDVVQAMWILTLEALPVTHKADDDKDEYVVKDTVSYVSFYRHPHHADEERFLDDTIQVRNAEEVIMLRSLSAEELMSGIISAHWIHVGKLVDGNYNNGLEQREYWREV